MLDAGTVILPVAGTGLRGCSLVSLNETVLGVAPVQLNSTVSSVFELPKRRTIQALPSSLGLKAVTCALVLERRNGSCLNDSPRARVTTRGEAHSSANLSPVE